MRRQLAVAVLMAGLVVPSMLRAQYRGGGRAAAPRASGPRFAGGRSFGGRVGGGFSGFRPAPGPFRSGGFRSGPIRTPFRTAAHRPGGFRGRPSPFPPRFFPRRRRFIQSPFFSGFGFPTTYFYAFPPYYSSL